MTPKLAMESSVEHLILKKKTTVCSWQSQRRTEDLCIVTSKIKTEKVIFAHARKGTCKILLAKKPILFTSLRPTNTKAHVKFQLNRISSSREKDRQIDVPYYNVDIYQYK